MKTAYFTDKNNIEDNALKCLEHFEQESHIEKIAVFPDIHYCSEKAIPVGVSFKTTATTVYAETAYDIADAMLKFREKQST